METTERKKTERRSLNDEFLEFRGSENYYRHSDLFFKFFLTDGVKHITEKLGLFWFLDTVLSYQVKRTVKAVKFQIWTLERAYKGRKRRAVEGCLVFRYNACYNSAREFNFVNR